MYVPTATSFSAPWSSDKVRGSCEVRGAVGRGKRLRRARRSRRTSAVDWAWLSSARARAWAQDRWRTGAGIGADPLSGHLFVSVNRQANYAKVLYWSRGGYSLWAKRLERGRFASAAGAGAAVPTSEPTPLMRSCALRASSTGACARSSRASGRSSSSMPSSDRLGGV